MLLIYTRGCERADVCIELTEQMFLHAQLSSENRIREPDVHILVSVSYCRLKEQKNLNSFFAVMFGLSNSAVQRLYKTWEVRIQPSDSIASGIAAHLGLTFSLCYREYQVRLKESTAPMRGWWWVAMLTLKCWKHGVCDCGCSDRTHPATTEPTGWPSLNSALLTSPSCLSYWKVSRSQKKKHEPFKC